MKISKIFTASFIISLPFQENIYASGFSLSFILMALLATYVLFYRWGSLNFIIKHSKIFRCFLFFLMSITVIETFHSNAAYKDILRSFFILGGTVLLATILLNKNGIVFIAKMYLISGILVAFNLLLFGYGVLLGGAATSFYEADLIRDQIAGGVTIEQDFNNLAFNQGVSALIAASFLFFSNDKKNRHYFFIGLVITFIGMIVTMSRGGLITLMGTVLFLFYYFKVGGVKKFLLPIAFLFLITTFVPATYFTRFNIDLSKDAAEKEGRARVFNVSINTILEEGVFGVGEGNYWSDWGKSSDFARYSARGVSVSGTHNLFFQIIINWGIISISIFIIFLYTIYSFRPKRNDNSTESYLFILIFVASLLYMAQIHNLQTKDFMILFSIGIIQEMNKKFMLIPALGSLSKKITIFEKKQDSSSQSSSL